MPDPVIDEAWENMQQLVRDEAKKLVDDFPNFPAETMTSPVIAEQFCQMPAPQDTNEVLLRQLAMTSTMSIFSNTRLSLSMRAMYRR